MTEWFEGRSTDEEQMEKCYWRRVGFVIFLAVVAGLILIPLNAHAEPVLQTNLPDGTVITLHTDKCELKEVTNLDMRATWQDKAGTYEGCWRPSSFFPLFLFFFREDKTVADIPASVFKKVLGV